MSGPAVDPLGQVGAFIGAAIAVGYLAEAADLGHLPEARVPGGQDLHITAQVYEGLAMTDLYRAAHDRGLSSPYNPPNYRLADLGVGTLTMLGGPEEAVDLALVERLVAEAASFSDALARAAMTRVSYPLLMAVGAYAGERFGLQGIPSRWTSVLTTPRGRGGIDAIIDDARRFAGLEVVPRTRPDPASAPKRVDPNLPIYAADLLGAASCSQDYRVLSLCRTDNRFADHADHRQVYLVDQEGEDANPHLAFALDDAVASIEAWTQGTPVRPIVVHCHAGSSRTGFVLKAWAMQRYGYTEEQAHSRIARVWPRISRWNKTFYEELLSREA